MDLESSSLIIEHLLESNALKSRFSVRGLAACVLMCTLLQYVACLSLSLFGSDLPPRHADRGKRQQSGAQGHHWKHCFRTRQAQLQTARVLSESLM